ncbi:MAG: hypothetical protein U0359_00845 [Byssovorax sp.]
MSVGLLIAGMFAWALGCGAGPLVTPGGATSTGTGGDSSTGGGGSGNGPPVLALVPGAPAAPAKEPMIEAHSIEGYATAVAAQGTLIAAGTTLSVVQVSPGDPAPLPIAGDEPDLPLETGAIKAMAPYEGGLLVAAESALFYTEGGALQLSQGSATLHPLGLRWMGARVVDGGTDAMPETHLALLGKSGAYELSKGSLIAWTVEGESGAPTAIYAQQERVFVAYGHAVYEIDRATKKAYPLVFDIGSVTEIACASLGCPEGSLLYFASDRGLIERSADGAYTRYPLAAEGKPAVPVETFALDAGHQRLYAIAGATLLRVRAGDLPVTVATLSEPTLPRRMAVDDQGDVWLGEGSSVKRIALGTPLSFETDVRPIVHEYCAPCHATGTQGAPKLDFETYASFVETLDTVLKRVKDGTMPPLTYDKKLPADKVQILEQWAVTKAP